MDNDNCLAGMRCPTCGAEEPFRIAVTTTLVMWDDGSDPEAQLGALDWEDDSSCTCISCDYAGRVQDFRAHERRRAFVESIARLQKEGEPTGFAFEDDEARDSLHELIDEARALLGTARPTPEGDPHGQ